MQLKPDIFHHKNRLATLNPQQILCAGRAKPATGHSHLYSSSDPSPHRTARITVAHGTARPPRGRTGYLARCDWLALTRSRRRRGEKKQPLQAHSATPPSRFPFPPRAPSPRPRLIPANRTPTASLPLLAAFFRSLPRLPLPLGAPPNPKSPRAGRRNSAGVSGPGACEWWWT